MIPFSTLFIWIQFYRVIIQHLNQAKRRFLYVLLYILCLTAQQYRYSYFVRYEENSEKMWSNLQHS